MSLLKDLEARAAELEARVKALIEEADGEALHLERALVADMSASIARFKTFLAAFGPLLDGLEARFASAVETYGPEVLAAVKAEVQKFMSEVEALLGSL